MKKYTIALLSMFAVPFLASAQTTLSPLNNVNDAVTRVATIANVIVYLLIGLAIVFIVWNVVMYFIRGGEEENRKKAGMSILWGLVGLAIILSIWGLVNIITGTFGVDSNTADRNRFPGADFVSNANTAGTSGTGSGTTFAPADQNQSGNYDNSNYNYGNSSDNSNNASDDNTDNYGS